MLHKKTDESEGKEKNMEDPGLVAEYNLFFNSRLSNP